MNQHRRGPAWPEEQSSAGNDPQPRAAIEIEAQLRALLPGLRVLDRDLELDGAPVADLVCEAEGRLVLVLMVDGEGDGPVLAALDALAAARRDGELLAAHLGLPESFRRAPLVLLVAERFGERLRERLRAIPSEALWSLERRAVRTARRGDQALVRVHNVEGCGSPASGGGSPSPDPQAVQRFLAQLGPPGARLGRELAQRIGRIDPELELETRRGEGREELWWRFRGRSLCGVAVNEGRLEGRLPDSSVPHAIQSPQALEAFLEWVLSCHLELLDALAPRDGMGEIVLVPPRREPLLTPEEIEAFRE